MQQSCIQEQNENNLGGGWETIMECIKPPMGGGIWENMEVLAFF